jgi:xanthine dehydrogenase YagT iron-sulfur-binding subunit
MTASQVPALGLPPKSTAQTSATVAQCSVRLKVNGESHALDLDPRTTLLDALREHLRLTGTKKGCDQGQCGACTVIVEGRRINSCLTLAVMHQGDEITTIEGLGVPGALHPMQKAFVEHDGLQCGYCTPGMIMASTQLLERDSISHDDIRRGLEGNLCRCTGYQHIVLAVEYGWLRRAFDSIKSKT